MTEPRQDPIVDALVSDPAVGPPSAAVLTGYLGKSSTPDSWRLYLNRALDRYVDIPANQILHSTELPNDGGTRVWVPRSLKLDYVRTVSAQVQAGFLQGSIVGRYRPATGPAVAEAAAIARRRRGMNARGFFDIADIDETIWGCGDTPTMHDWGGCASMMGDCPI
jgi:hypothetical protein